MHPLQQIRRDRYITRLYLAERTGIAPSTIARIENGETKRPHRTVRDAILRELDLPESEVFPP